MAEDIWSGECSMEWDQGEDFDEFVKAIGVTPQTVVISMKRSWRNRLFTRPWRPLHGWIVFTGVTAKRDYDLFVMRPDGTRKRNTPL